MEKEQSKYYKWVKKAREKKRRLLAELKDGKPCMDCGIRYPHFVLHWHHRNPEEKSFEISQAVRNNIAWERIILEMEKCDLICGNCHAIREWS